MRTFIRTSVLSLLLSLAAFGAHAQSLPIVPVHFISLASTNSTLVSGAGQNVLKWVVASNNSGTVNFLKFYDKATAPTCGTDIPVFTVMVPTNTTGGGVTAVSLDDTRFSRGIGFCLTAGVADNDTQAAQPNIAISIGYLWQ
jgi:hypothetical protein